MIIRNIEQLINDSANGEQFLKSVKFAYKDITAEQVIDDIDFWQSQTMVNQHERIIVIQSLIILNREISIKKKLEQQ